MRLPIGYDDFGAVIDHQLKFVDKSLFIKDIIDDSAQVILITRPRRFGKTFNLSLLHYFFSDHVFGRKTEHLFDHLKIAKEPDYFIKQGKYPVITLTFKDIKGDTYEQAYGKLCQVVSRAYLQHEAILNEKLNPTQKQQFKKQFSAILNRTADETILHSALHDLTYYLFECYHCKPIVLIDEYDTPIQIAYTNGYYDKAINLMRNFLSPALKNNLFLEKAVLTGVLRVAKESLFSGLNNIAVYSLFRQDYSQYFGFTESEVYQLLHEIGLSEKAILNELIDVKKWYNGYQIGNTVVYNPWSIVNYLKHDRIFEPYWLNTSDNYLAKELFANSSSIIKQKFRSLLDGHSIEARIDDNFTFSQLKSDKNESALWSLFLMGGYLNIASQKMNSNGARLCQLRIPNLEVRSIYVLFFEEWFSSSQDTSSYHNFLDRLLNADMSHFEEDIQKILIKSVSVHDTAKKPENFYQGFLLGITIGLDEDNYSVKLNREAGFGRCDIMIIPNDRKKFGIIFELKSIHSEKNNQLIKLSEAAQKALEQINDRSYAAELKSEGIQSICKIGLAFDGKRVKIAYEIE